MTYRIQMTGSDDARTLTFEGTLDGAALADLVARCDAAAGQRARVHVRLLAGTRVEAGALDDLVRVEGIVVTAEAPFLARWIDRCVGPLEPRDR
jgi:hypothetical protein